MFTFDERWALMQIAEAATPPGRVLGPPSAGTLAALEALLGGVGGLASTGYRAALHALDLATVPTDGARLSSLPVGRRQEVLARLDEDERTHPLVRAVVGPLKIARLDAAPELERFLAGPSPTKGPWSTAGLPVAVERPRWQERMSDARELPDDEEISVDVVVVGSGAGGAPVAARLAARGHAVLVLEEGGHFGRKDFGGRPLAMQRKLYRDHGLTLATGNALIPVPVGRTVGGTTTINSGTCYRTPDDVLRRWQLEGMHDLGPGSLDPYFERVEAMIGVEVSPASVLGGVARVIARGSAALGYAHGPLARNAPGCDARGVCCFGCPTDAKRSTNVSYIPAALERGATLMHHVRVTSVLVEGGRAVGVEAAVRGDGEGGPERRLRVRARAVVLACGSLHTPALLLANGLANSSGRVGRDLTIHPCSFAWATLPDPVRGWEEVPQGYSVEEFVDQGIRFEGGFAPLPFVGGTLAPIGAEWTEIVERFEHFATFGFMIRETSRGRVRLGLDGRPSVRYPLNDADRRTILRGQAILARIFLAGGAQLVQPGLRGAPRLQTLADVERFEREATDRVRARDIDLSAYHPLGTCRMGADPRRSVVGPDHEAHDVPGLFVCDGSAVSGPLGVNPQVTIMALSERAADFVERRIELTGRRRAPRPARRELVFEETMSGPVVRAPDLRPVEASFTVRAAGELGLGRALAERGGTLALEGTIGVPGLATDRPCAGSLRMRPLLPRANVVYDLTFTADDGSRCTLHGEKHAPLFSPRGMTRLHTEIRRDGEIVARGLLRFHVGRDLGTWLASFRLAARPPEPEPAREPAGGQAPDRRPTASPHEPLATGG